MYGVQNIIDETKMSKDESRKVLLCRELMAVFGEPLEHNISENIPI